MGVPALNHGIKDEVHRLSRMIDQCRFPQAAKLMTRMASRIGEDHPELLRLRSLIAFLNLVRENESHCQECRTRIAH